MGRLAISRKEGESVLIGETGRIKIVEIKGSGKKSVKLLIDLPDDILILREELVDHETRPNH